MEMERKLAEYRARKAREAKIEEIRGKTKNLFANLWKTRQKPEPDSSTEILLAPDETSDFVDEISSVCSEEEEEELKCWTWSDFLWYCLWFIFWCILYAIFIKYQFGTVFLISSGIIFMFINTRTGPKRAGEVSAYSVFNKNCESIDGTLKAEQFEREIRYGHTAVH